MTFVLADSPEVAECQGMFIQRMSHVINLVALS